MNSFKIRRLPRVRARGVSRSVRTYIDKSKKFYPSVMVQPEPSPKPGTIRVLHVDDEETQRKYAKAFLEMADESIRVESAVSPEEARARHHRC